MVWLIFKILIAISAALLIYWTGAGMVRMFASSPPPDDERDALVPVDVRFECVVCGTQITITAAPGGEVPHSPRHCMEEMNLVADYRSQ